MSVTTQRRVRSVAAQIEADWKHKNPSRRMNRAARRCLDAMHHLDSVEDSLGSAEGRAIVAEFLHNAKNYHSPISQELKAELRALL